jgi:hypothetical protein
MRNEALFEITAVDLGLHQENAVRDYKQKLGEQMLAKVANFREDVRPEVQAQRKPYELGSFSWIVDGKEPAKVTRWEEWWAHYAQGARLRACQRGDRHGWCPKPLMPTTRSMNNSIL